MDGSLRSFLTFQQDMKGVGGADVQKNKNVFALFITAIKIRLHQFLWLSLSKNPELTEFVPSP